MKLECLYPDYGYFLYTEATEINQYKQEIAEYAIKTFQSDFDLQFGYNVRLDPHKFPLIKEIYAYFFKMCVNNFDNVIVDQRNREIAWTYVQNKETSSNVWHNHKRTTTINAVWYPKIPDPTGTLAIREGEAVDEIQVKEGFIYFFPYWLDHKPMPQKNSDDWRVSINLELLTVTRPLYPPTQTLW